jgi:hypothetical protein
MPMSDNKEKKMRRLRMLRMLQYYITEQQALVTEANSCNYLDQYITKGV